MSGDLPRLRTGSCGWVRDNAGYLDSSAGQVELPTIPRVKALLQLAGVVRCWARIRPDDPGLAELDALLRRVWPRAGLPDVIAANPRYACQYGLMYCALAPPAEPCSEVRARLATDEALAGAGVSPYLRLELAYYAELAGIAHGGGSYRELYAASLLARRSDALPITDADACTIAHTIFYLSDYGLRTPELDPAETERARHLVEEWTVHFSRRQEWDNVAKFVLAQCCLGLDATRTPSGAAGIRLLAGVQDTSGAIPGPALRSRPGPGATRTQRFRLAYQTTLMTAIMSLMVSSAST